MKRLLLPILLVLPCVLRAQPEDGRLYNPPSLELRGWLGSEENVSARSRIVIERTVTEVRHPLLPIIFFEQGSARFPERYTLLQQPGIAGGYTDTSSVLMKVKDGKTNFLSPSQGVTKYYELLDIVGYRLHRFPDAILRIEGGYSGEGTESAALGMLRAEAVRDHLLANWGVGANRIVLLPPRRLCDSAASPMRQQEARRVTLFCNDPRVLADVHFQLIGTNSRILNLGFTLNPRFSSSDIRTIELSVAMGDILLYRGDLPVSPDSSVYHLHGLVPILWATNDVRVPDNQVNAQAVVVLNDGRRFASNQARLDFEERLVPSNASYLSSFMERGSPEFVLPYFDRADTGISEAQGAVLAAFLHQVDSAVTAPIDMRVLDSSIDAAVKQRVEIARQIDSMRSVISAMRRGTDGDGGDADREAGGTKQSRSMNVENFVRSQRRLIGLPLDPSVRPRPRLVIHASLDQYEQNPDEERIYSNTASANPNFGGWRELNSSINRRMLDGRDPPQLAFVNESTDMNDVMTGWLGFDMRQRVEAMMRQASDEADGALQSAFSALDTSFEVRDTASFANTDSLEQARLERTAIQNTILRGRVRSVAALLGGVRPNDSTPLLLTLDTTSSHVGFYETADMEQRLPETRFAARRVVVTLRYDDEPSANEYNGDDVDVDSAVEGAESSSSSDASAQEGVAPVPAPQNDRREAMPAPSGHDSPSPRR